MKVTGIVRRIDDLGRVAIPKEMRKILNIKEGDPLEIFIEDDMVCLKRYSVNYKTDIEMLIRDVADDKYSNFDKGEVLNLLYEVRDRVTKPL